MWLFCDLCDILIREFNIGLTTQQVSYLINYVPGVWSPLMPYDTTDFLIVVRRDILESYRDSINSKLKLPKIEELGWDEEREIISDF